MNDWIRKCKFEIWWNLRHYDWISIITIIITFSVNFIHHYCSSVIFKNLSKWLKIWKIFQFFQYWKMIEIQFMLWIWIDWYYIEYQSFCTEFIATCMNSEVQWFGSKALSENSELNHVEIWNIAVASYTHLLTVRQSIKILVGNKFLS